MEFRDTQCPVPMEVGAESKGRMVFLVRLKGGDSGGGCFAWIKERCYSKLGWLAGEWACKVLSCSPGEEFRPAGQELGRIPEVGCG